MESAKELENARGKINDVGLGLICENFNIKPDLPKLIEKSSEAIASIVRVQEELRRLEHESKIQIRRR